MENRKVTYVKLHGGDAFIPSIGGLGTTLPPSNKTLNMTMIHSSEGVVININSGTPRSVEALIPWANIQLVVYERLNEK